MKFAFGVYVNEPSGLNVTVPWEGCAASTAVSGSPSASVAPISRPGAGTENALFSVTLEGVGLVTTGGLLVRLTTTVAGALVMVPSLAVNWNESVPVTVPVGV